MRITFIGQSMEAEQRDVARHIQIEGAPLVSLPEDMDDVRVIFDSGEVADLVPVEGGGFYVAFGDLSEGEFVLIPTLSRP